MSIALIYKTISTGSDDTQRLGELLGSKLAGGEVIELRADLGGGKTTFTQGLVRGAGSADVVSSPTFTLKKIYRAGGLQIFHYDFYRLSEPGILKAELAESINDPKAITVIEWSDIVADVLPLHISIQFKPTANDPDEREIIFNYAEKSTRLIKEIEAQWTGERP